MRNYGPIGKTLMVVLLALVLIPAPARAQELLTGSALVAALKRGGYVVVLRHASSLREVPNERTAHPDNTARERQLDEAGRAAAGAIGKALRDLAIPIRGVLSSPTYRALETVRLAQWQNPQIVPELGDRGQSMQGVTEADGAWLRNRVTQFANDSNTILVTHLPNITRAFPQHASGVADGDALVFGPSGDGAAVVAHIKVADWLTLRQ
jgi:phosphohistidine phosphatase SixA